MNAAYLDVLAAAGAAEITHIGLVNGAGTPVGDGRKAVTWTAPASGLIRPTADLVFAITAGEQPAAWRGYNAATAGTDYEGAPLSPAPSAYGNDGTYTLEAASTSIAHNAG